MTDYAIEAREDIWLGIDLGTQSVRVLAVGDSGAVLGQGSSALTSRREGGRHEQDPEGWWRAVTTACRAALKGLSTSSIRGVAVDGTSGTILLVDARGRAITPALMYDDARASEQIGVVNDAGGKVWATLGYRMQTSWALPKLVWLLANQYDTSAGRRLVHQTDFITWRLAGRQVATDMSTALKTGYNLIEESWPYEIMDALGVPEDILPNVLRSGSQLGTVGAEASAATGIPVGTPIIAGMTDGCAAQIGAGALSPGSWNSVLGTTLVLKGVTEQLLHDPAGVVYSHRSPDGGWLPGGASSTGAGILASSFPGRRLDELNARAAEREPASVVIYPLASHGERFPFVAPDAEGFILGTPRDEIDHYAGLLQGIAYIERLCFDYLDLLGAPITGELRLSGGGTRSRYWSQLRADILSRPVSITENTEPALGMAILAASAGGKVAATAARMVHVQEVIEPRPASSKRFSAPYIRLVRELEERGWLPSHVAHHALISVS